MVRLGHVADNKTGAFSYVDPDGNKITGRPAPGMIWTTSNGNGSYDQWMWDDPNTYWILVANCAPPTTFFSAPIKFVPISIIIEDLEAAIKCECGSDKLGHPGHSHWCRKFAP